MFIAAPVAGAMPRPSEEPSLAFCPCIPWAGPGRRSGEFSAFSMHPLPSASATESSVKPSRVRLSLNMHQHAPGPIAGKVLCAGEFSPAAVARSLNVVYLAPSTELI